MSATARGQCGIATYAPDGVSDPRWLGAVGHVSAVSYGSTMPGGDDQFQCTLAVPRLYREPSIMPGRILRVWRGAGVIYEGRLDRPAPDTAGQGWTVTAHGSGTYGDDYLAIYSSYTAANILSQATGRGLAWNTGTTSGGNVSQVADSGSQTVSAFLNAYTDTLSLTWFVDQPGWPHGTVINVMAVPTTVTRILVTTVPAAPDLVDYINSLYVRYQSSAGSGSTPAAYALTNSTLPASITQHGLTEDYWDLSSNGVLTAGAAQSAAASALSRYVSASFSQPFVAIPGQYLTADGTEVDLGCERAGEVVRLQLAAGGFGGEIGPVWPVTFPVGAVSYDDDSGHLTITPYQAVQSNFSGLLGILGPGVKPKPKPKPRPRHPHQHHHHHRRR